MIEKLIGQMERFVNWAGRNLPQNDVKVLAEKARMLDPDSEPE